MKIFNIPVYIDLPPDIERRFKELMPRRFVPFMRIGLIIGFLSYPVWLLWDYQQGTAESFAEAVHIRLGMMLFFAAAFGLSFLTKTGRTIYLLATVVLVATVWTTYATLSLVPEGMVYCSGIGLLPMIFVTAMSSFGAAAATILLSLGVMNAYLVAGHEPGAVLFSFNFTHATLAGLSLGMVYLGIQVRRHSFLLETNLEKATRDAETANKAKSEFLATMSHEVRTPLNGILGIIALLKDTALGAQQRDYVETVRYSGETLLTILNDILDFSKMEAGKFDIEPVDFDVERLIASALDLLRSRAEEKGLKLVPLVGAGVPRFLRGDVTRLRQVLLNLIGNAIKFTAAGRVTIRVSYSDAQNGPPLLRFAVEDTGIGISEEAQKKLFQQFSQADSSVSRRFGGTGLGLAICRRIVELMQGAIGVTSRPGEGSVFWFEIPAVPAQNPVTDTSANEAAAMPPLRPLSILVAEDNKINQKVVTGLLEKFGHKVTLAADGQEALDFLERGVFDLVLMDMQMPLMDGLAATVKLRQLSGPVKDIPVIALTANAVGGDEQRCRAAGMNDYVSKPINPAALYQAIAGQVSVPAASAQVASSPAALAAEPEQKPALENLSNLEKLMGRDYVTNFIEEGLTEVARLIGVLDKGAGDNSADAMREAAHELKGISALFGLGAVQALAEGIERCCLEKRTEEARALDAQLKNTYDSSVIAFRQALPAAGWAQRSAALH